MSDYPLRIRSAGAEPHFVTSIGDPDIRNLYEDLYCACGEMESQIKKQLLHLFSCRISCRR